MIEILNPNPVPSKILGTIDYFRWRHVDFITRMENDKSKVPSYYLELGERYLFLFKQRILLKLTTEGQQWVHNTALALQVELETILSVFPDIERNPKEFNKRLYIAHFKVYFKTGFHQLPLADRQIIFQHIKYSDLKKLLNR